MDHVEIYAIDESEKTPSFQLLVYNDSKLSDIIYTDIEDELGHFLYKLPNNRVLVELPLSGTETKILIINTFSKQIELIKDVVNIINFHSNNESNTFLVEYKEDKFEFMNITDNINYIPTNIKYRVMHSNYVIRPHVDFNARLIEDTLIIDNKILTYDNKLISNLNLVDINTIVIGWIEDMIIYKTKDSILLQLDDQITTWDIKNLFGNEMSNNIRFNAVISYTSIPIISCTLLLNNVIHVALIRLMNYNNVDIENYIITNIYNADINKDFSTYITLDVDDYGFILNVEWNINGNNHNNWIYQSRISPTTYRGKGSSAIINHDTYIKDLKLTMKESVTDHIFPTLSNIVSKYM